MACGYNKAPNKITTLRMTNVFINTPFLPVMAVEGKVAQAKQT
jgi:hypothetical protein